MSHGVKPYDGVYAQNLARRLVTDGYKAEEVLATVSNPKEFLESEALRLSMYQHAAFLEHVVRITKNDLIGVEFSSSQDLLESGLTGYLAQASATVQDAFQRLADFGSLYRQAVAIKLELTSEGGLVTWGYDGAHNLPLPQCAEFTAGVLLRSLSAWAGVEIQPQELAFRHCRTRNIAALTEAYGVRPKFRGGRNYMRFSEKTLATPLLTHDPKLLGILLDHANLKARQSRLDNDEIVVAVENKIIEMLPEGRAALSNIAREMGMSPRTLSRRLADEGSGFFEILEGVRRALSFSYLKDSDLTVGQVAQFLGYSSLSSFNDAFKRWTGVSPSKYRS